MIRLAFTAQDVATTRFAVSPLWEVVASVRVLKSPDADPLHASWVRQVRPRLAQSGVDWRPLADLVPVPTRVIPGFVCPPPATTAPDLELELAALCAMPPAEVHSGLDALPTPLPPSLAELRNSPRAGLEQLAEVIRSYWNVVLEPFWPRIQSLLDGEVLYRARRLVEGGASRLFDDLDPNIAWDTDTLRVSTRHCSRSLTLDGRGLLLVPSVFTWPRVFSVVDPPYQPTLRYPPRGIATLWESPRHDPDQALAAVIGRSRARLLSELDSPASTTDLAQRTGLTTGAVSQHLTALRAAGIISAHRTGRYVLYARTRVAETLLTQAAGDDGDAA